MPQLAAKPQPQTDPQQSVGRLVAMAREQFPPTEFAHVPKVQVFCEHSTTDGDGNPVVYDRGALEAICQRCNERIADTGDFPPLTDGHTPGDDQPERAMPDVLGYVGPFFLGVLGNENPRVCIFAHEWHHREDRDKLKKLRRRSPEVWLEDSMRDRFFDPIAALGAETPRLDMGIARYGRLPNGRVVEKYAATVAASGNVMAPRFGKHRNRNNYSCHEDYAMLSPEDANGIIDALMQTKPMQWVMQQMNADQPDESGDDLGAEPDAGLDGLGEDGFGDGLEDEPGADALQDDAELRDDDEPDQYGLVAAIPAAMSALGAGKNRHHAKPKDSKVNTKHSRAASDSRAHADRLAERRERSRYAKLEQEVASLRARAEAAETQSELESRENEIRTERYGRAFDEDRLIEKYTAQDEKGKLKYSRETFDAVMEALRETAPQIPTADAVPRLHTGGLDRPERTSSAQSEKYSKRAVSLVDRARAEGKKLTFEEAYEQAKKESA